MNPSEISTPWRLHEICLKIRYGIPEEGILVATLINGSIIVIMPVYRRKTGKLIGNMRFVWYTEGVVKINE